MYVITRQIAQRAGQLKSAFAATGKTLALADMIVAATSLEHDLTLLTDNRKGFIVPGLNMLPLP